MKSLQQFINEGSWGYDPNQNDGALDLRGSLFLSSCELIYDRLNTNHKDTCYVWESLGNIEYFFEEFSKIKDFGLDNKNKFEKYYYWFRLIDLKNKNIIELYAKYLEQCKNDEIWINDWKEPDKMKESLKKREKKLKEYQKLFEEKKKVDKEIKTQQNDNKTVKNIVFN